MLMAMHQIDHPMVRLSFDTAALPYYNQGMNVEVALAKVCHLVRHVRLRDSGGEFGSDWFPALGYGGAVDFVRVWQLMSVCGFFGPYAILVEHGSHAGVRDVADCVDGVRKSLRTLRDCGFLDGLNEPLGV